MAKWVEELVASVVYHIVVFAPIIIASGMLGYIFVLLLDALVG